MQIKDWRWTKLIVCWIVGLLVFMIWGSIVATFATGLLPFGGTGIPETISDWFLGTAIKALVMAPLLILLGITWKWLRRPVSER